MSTSGEYFKQNEARLLDELVQFLRIPSISNTPSFDQDVAKAAEWIANKLRGMGAEVEIVPTERHPVVFGEILRGGATTPTIMIYGHYDVQPVEPLADWSSDPFEPEVRGENLYARGATDMKGQVMATVAAVEAVLATGTPINVKFVIEGEEEIGSAHFGDFLRSRRQRLDCDVVLNPDAGGMPSPEYPVVVRSLRGGVALNLTVFGPQQDLHSGLYGGTIHNPIHALSALIAGMHDAEGRIAVPGFYETVRVLSAEERAEIAESPLDENTFLEQTRVPELWGEPEYTPLERVGARPTIEVVRITAGQAKSAIPAQASALFLCRLVADQDPKEVEALMAKYIEAHAPKSIRWELQFLRGGRAVEVGANVFGMQQLADSLEAVFERKPLYLRDGGSIHAVALFQEILGVDSLLSGFSLMDDHLHGPDEKIHLPTWRKGVQALIIFLEEMTRKTG